MNIKSFTFSTLYIFSISACMQNTNTEISQLAKSKTEIILTDTQRKNIGIVLGHPTEHFLSETINLTGKIDVPPQHIVNITAPFGGFLRNSNLIVGMFVKKGQSLADIENPYYIQLQQEYVDSQSQIGFLEAEFYRQEELALENVNSLKSLQKAKADWLSMKAKNMGALAKLKMLNINPEDLNKEVFKPSIKLFSPISGYVTEVNTTIGSFASPSQPIFKIVNTNHIHVELMVFERDLPKISIGQTVNFTLSSENTPRKAKVYLMGKQISVERTVQIHCHIEKEDSIIIPGMYVKADIKIGGTKALTVLPESAVINFDGSDYIFVKTDEHQNNFKMVEIVSGISDSGLIEVNLPKEIGNKNLSIVINGGFKLLATLQKSEENE